MNKSILFIISFILISSVSALPGFSQFSFQLGDNELPPVKINSCLPLIQYCANCTFVNITSLSYPNGTTINLGYTTKKISQDTYINNSFCDTSSPGTYIYSTFGNPDGLLFQQAIKRQVTATGNDFTIQKSILYISLLTVAIIIFFTTLVGGIIIPSDNKRDEMTGYILAVSNLKYVKIFSYAISYVMSIVIFYFLYTLSFAFLEFNFISSIFYAVFYILVVCLFPLFVVGVYIVIANAVRDHKVGEMLSGGLRIR